MKVFNNFIPCIGISLLSTFMVLFLLSMLIYLITLNVFIIFTFYYSPWNDKFLKHYDKLIDKILPNDL
jgi:hypothetical protein